ncbi:unnamed protein product, partial [Nesidiocoris tenuis]
MYPEGTRNPTMGEFLQFKRGAFKVAMESNVPVIPLTPRGPSYRWFSLRIILSTDATEPSNEQVNPRSYSPPPPSPPPRLSARHLRLSVGHPSISWAVALWRAPGRNSGICQN